MVTKNYDKAFDELIKCLAKNTKDAKCVTALKYIVNEYEGEVNLKEIVIKDYAKFLSFWFPYVRETSKTSLKMQNYLLNRRFIIPDPWTYFQGIWHLAVKDNGGNGKMYHLVSHTDAIIKALIQTQRRKLGFDQNSTKY